MTRSPRASSDDSADIARQPLPSRHVRREAVVAEIVWFRGTFGMYVREIAPLIGMSEVALEQVFYRARRRGEIPSNWTPNGGRHRDTTSR